MLRLHTDIVRDRGPRELSVQYKDGILEYNWREYRMWIYVNDIQEYKSVVIEYIGMPVMYICSTDTETTRGELERTTIGRRMFILPLHL